MKQNKNETIKLNLGCGGRPLPEYINVDMDSLAQLRARYPNQEFSDDIIIHDYDILNLPYTNASVAEIRADAFIEHLTFIEEKKFFYEVARVLKKNGLFHFTVPNFEEIVKIWLKAKDEWKDFYRDDEEAIRTQHWFGQNSYSLDSRWGYLTAIFYGSQNGAGQFHKNCYTEGKIKGIMKKLDFSIDELSFFLWKGDRDPMIKVLARKN